MKEEYVEAIKIRIYVPSYLAADFDAVLGAWIARKKEEGVIVDSEVHLRAASDPSLRGFGNDWEITLYLPRKFVDVYEMTGALAALEDTMKTLLKEAERAHKRRLEKERREARKLWK